MKNLDTYLSLLKGLTSSAESAAVLESVAQCGGKKDLCQLVGDYLLERNVFGYWHESSNTSCLPTPGLFALFATARCRCALTVASKITVRNMLPAATEMPGATYEVEPIRKRSKITSQLRYPPTNWRLSC